MSCLTAVEFFFFVEKEWGISLSPRYAVLSPLKGGKLGCPSSARYAGTFPQGKARGRLFPITLPLKRGKVGEAVKNTLPLGRGRD